MERTRDDQNKYDWQVIFVIQTHAIQITSTVTTNVSRLQRSVMVLRTVVVALMKASSVVSPSIWIH